MLKRLMRKKAIISPKSFTFKETTSFNLLCDNKCKKYKYVFIAEIECPSNYEILAKGYIDDIDVSPFYCGMLPPRLIIIQKFKRYYEKIIPVEEAKKEFLSKMVVRKKHFEECK